MYDLQYELMRLADRNRDGSYQTQYERRKVLLLIGQQLVEMGYKQMHPGDIKGRHVQKLIQRWKDEGISDGTMCNRASFLRWWCEKVGRPGVMAKSNSVYGIGQRARVSVASKGKVLEEEALAQVTDAYVRMSLRLIVAWGLRRKESLMLRPHLADGGDHLKILGNWAKNGRERTIALTFPDQRIVVDAAKDLVQHTGSSLIPDHLRYVDQRNKLDFWVQKIGLGGPHGLRHTWAQRRYGQLAGFPCPHAGGPLWAAMTAAQRQQDRVARQILSGEMGHNRLEITDVYIGSTQGGKGALQEHPVISAHAHRIQVPPVQLSWGE